MLVAPLFEVLHRGPDVPVKHIAFVPEVELCNDPVQGAEAVEGLTVGLVSVLKIDRVREGFVLLADVVEEVFLIQFHNSKGLKIWRAGGRSGPPGPVLVAEPPPFQFAPDKNAIGKTAGPPPPLFGLIDGPAFHGRKAKPVSGVHNQNTLNRFHNSKDFRILQAPARSSPEARVGV